LYSARWSVVPTAHAESGEIATTAFNRDSPLTFGLGNSCQRPSHGSRLIAGADLAATADATTIMMDTTGVKRGNQRSQFLD
jgi:hypothetical protein